MHLVSGRSIRRICTRIRWLRNRRVTNGLRACLFSPCFILFSPSFMISALTHECANCVALSHGFTNVDHVLQPALPPSPLSAGSLDACSCYSCTLTALYSRNQPRNLVFPSVLACEGACWMLIRPLLAVRSSRCRHAFGSPTRKVCIMYSCF